MIGECTRSNIGCRVEEPQPAVGLAHVVEIYYRCGNVAIPTLRMPLIALQSVSRGTILAPGFENRIQYPIDTKSRRRRELSRSGDAK